MFSEIVFVLFFLFFLLTSLFRRLEKLYIKKIRGVWGEGCRVARDPRLADSDFSMNTLAFIRLSEELILSFLKGSLGTFWRHLGRLLGSCGGQILMHFVLWRLFLLLLSSFHCLSSFFRSSACTSFRILGSRKGLEEVIRFSFRRLQGLVKVS